jgi:hypothetical protein
MKPTADSQGADAPRSELRRWMYVLLIVVAAAAVLGRILSAELVYEPSLSRNWPDDPGHYRRSWPAPPPRAMPTFSSNDRSRWAAVRALVDNGTWVIGRRDKQVVIASAPAALAAADPLQLAVLLQVGMDRRIKSDTGIVFEDGWQSVDKMLNPATLEYYSTKPPLLTFLLAGEYWLLKHALGWSLQDVSPGSERDQRFAVVRVCLLTFNLVPFLIYLGLLAWLVEHFGLTDWGRLFVVTAACFGTLMTPFLISINNHTLAACSVVVTVYATVRILSDAPESWSWFVIAGFLAGFTAVNELPAAAFAAGLTLLLLVRIPRKAMLVFVPSALVPVAALLALNYAELGEFNVGYSKFETEWYDYEGSHWRNLPDKSKRGIDWAKNKEDKPTYAFHLLLGHHGWFSLTPMYLMALGGMGLGVRYLYGLHREYVEQKPETRNPKPGSSQAIQLLNFGFRKFFRISSLGSRFSAQRLWAELAVSTAMLSLVVIGYYIYKSDNYSGWSNGPRWLLWLSPLMLLSMLPIADRLGMTRTGRILCLVLLALSVLSAHYWDWNPWRHPWIYNWMDSRGWIPY